ncbi:MAG: hypothetical protein AAB360_00750 [Patescibacteria group bacterium]
MTIEGFKKVVSITLLTATLTALLPVGQINAQEPSGLNPGTNTGQPKTPAPPAATTPSPPDPSDETKWEYIVSESGSNASMAEESLKDKTISGRVFPTDQRGKSYFEYDNQKLSAFMVTVNSSGNFPKTLYLLTGYKGYSEKEAILYMALPFYFSDQSGLVTSDKNTLAFMRDPENYYIGDENTLDSVSYFQPNSTMGGKSQGKVLKEKLYNGRYLVIIHSNNGGLATGKARENMAYNYFGLSATNNLNEINYLNRLIGAVQDNEEIDVREVRPSTGIDDCKDKFITPLMSSETNRQKLADELNKYKEQLEKANQDKKDRYKSLINAYDAILGGKKVTKDNVKNLISEKDDKELYNTFYASDEAMKGQYSDRKPTNKMLAQFSDLTTSYAAKLPYYKMDYDKGDITTTAAGTGTGAVISISALAASAKIAAGAAAANAATAINPAIVLAGNSSGIVMTGAALGTVGGIAVGVAGASATYMTYIIQERVAFAHANQDAIRFYTKMSLALYYAYQCNEYNKCLKANDDDAGYVNEKIIADLIDHMNQAQKTKELVEAECNVSEGGKVEEMIKEALCNLLQIIHNFTKSVFEFGATKLEESIGIQVK